MLALALAGHLARQRSREATLATLPTASLTFAAYLVGVIVIIGALSYFIVLALGPMAAVLGH